MRELTYSDFDREIWEKELENFVPSKVFDAHCHLWSESGVGSNQDSDSVLRLEIDGAKMKKWNQSVFPGRELGFYYLGTPLLGMDVEEHNKFLLGESKKFNFPAAAIVTPSVKGEEIARLFDSGFAGLKPYRVFAADPANCDIVDYLTEEQMEVANHYSKTVTLHLSKMVGLADPKNLDDLEKYAKKYPRIKWILAHCARAFNSFMLEGTIHRLANLGENFWCDNSAVCDTYSHFLLMKHFSRHRLLFGTDNVGAGCDRGKYITWGNAWAFFPGKDCPHCDGRATLVVYEQLRCIKQAADMAGLSHDELEDIFYYNATRFFNR